ncbi:hypothetical protein, variant [Blastomyces dermatitidis ER-3]|uniref:Uncharacterized protein n=2 Tax=Ajellomyces dermatitidis TaxID=5039 RepID=F2TAS1_AJEDA|nr:uncharacterized protein BDCG_17342 [Blastomyces dermatitidis ER-3]XP_045281748.1 hypothetical protein, variant [Blastomyces dermatitidis ER-3]EGE80334.1 hypothetical protein BDDG_03275 [Blastomyces dermatitidis ATCC 18188]KMW67247.1 hypothetical protein, variant [Blastomyces dermatitidis ATCC 18188]OAT02020.1 hypothetical protein BDCG_17342 [Blastomyces dermatitidis ER-3]OAT02021.1 hypothetical protein, variant [Blastomyces dermatitidis ER-3]
MVQNLQYSSGSGAYQRPSILGEGVVEANIDRSTYQKFEGRVIPGGAMRRALFDAMPHMEGEEARLGVQRHSGHGCLGESIRSYAFQCHNDQGWVVQLSPLVLSG